MSIYDPLRDYLKSQKFRELELTFAQIEQIIGRSLPRSADRPQWWANQVAPGRPLEAHYRLARDRGGRIEAELVAARGLVPA